MEFSKDSLDFKVKELIKIVHQLNKSFESTQEACDGAKSMGLSILPNEIDKVRTLLINWGAIKNSNRIFELTESGHIYAQSLIDEYMKSQINIPVEDVIKHIDNLIPELPYYGEFALRDKAYDNLSIITNESEAIIVKAKSDEKHLREETLKYMVFEGFAVNRTDIQQNNTLYRQLTDKGRKLKECGSLAEYNKLLEEENEKIKTFENDRKTEILRNKLLFEMNRYQLIVNISIAISTGVAAVFYLYSLFDFFEKHSLQWQFVSYFLSGFGLALLIWLSAGLIKKISHKNKKQT